MIANILGKKHEKQIPGTMDTAAKEKAEEKTRMLEGRYIGNLLTMQLLIIVFNCIMVSIREEI